MTIVRMAAYLCTVDGVPRRVHLCPSCFDVLREHITAAFNLARNAFSCDACTRKERTTK